MVLRDYRMNLAVNPRDLRTHYRAVRRRLLHPTNAPWSTPTIEPIEVISKRELFELRVQELVDLVVSERIPEIDRTAVVRARAATIFGVTIEDMISPRRSQDIAAPRMIAMALTARISKASRRSIALSYGNRDHTTLGNAEYKYGTLIDRFLSEARQ
jgi:hypothetical protein